MAGIGMNSMTEIPPALQAIIDQVMNLKGSSGRDMSPGRKAEFLGGITNVLGGLAKEEMGNIAASDRQRGINESQIEQQKIGIQPGMEKNAISKTLIPGGTGIFNNNSSSTTSSDSAWWKDDKLYNFKPFGF